MTLARAFAIDDGPARDGIARTIATSRLFRTLDPAFVATLAPHASIARLQQGERLWRRGTKAEHFHVVLRGVLELQRHATGPESTLVALFGPGESPAIPVTLERRPFIADSFASTRELEVLRVRAAPVLAALATDHALALAMNRALLEHCRLLHSKIDVMAAGTVPRRLAAFFLELVERFGDEHEDDQHHVPLALSRQQIATYVGARVETVIRCCSSWQKAGVIQTTRDGFVITRIEELRRILDAQASDDEAGLERGSRVHEVASGEWIKRAGPASR
ncbi:MAG: Crp/Fnr family transcriptional regulator [Myxococcota bacterium]|nr:Crp/Fnr family transcriptional regulator [Myxococcota bacterium]